MPRFNLQRFIANSPHVLWTAPLVCGCLPAIFLPLAQFISVARWGTNLFLWFEMLLGAISIPVIGILPVGAFFMLYQRFRRTAVLSSLSALAFFVGVGVGFGLGERIRMNGFAGLAESSKPLIEAIETYERHFGRPPESLDALVPSFLPSIPSTRMAAYPRFEYLAEEKAARYSTNPWVVYVVTPSGFSFDMFMYFPLQNYGRAAKKVDDWAYFHN